MALRFPAGPERGVVSVSLVLADQRPCGRCLRSPDLEANARTDVESANACRSVPTHKLVRHPELQIDRAEVVADQATSGGGLIAATEIHARSRSATAGIISRLRFEVANRANRPFADLVDGCKVAIERVTAS